jgi:hypothetical protein
MRCVDCLSHDNGGDGFAQVDHQGILLRCTSVGNTGDGFDLGLRKNTKLIDCVATHNGAYGFTGSGDDSSLIRCAGANNTSGDTNLAGPNALNLNFQSLGAAVDPWVNRTADDYRPNNTFGEGVSLRAAAYAVPPSQKNNTDIGAVQHAEAVFGGSTSSSNYHTMGNPEITSGDTPTSITLDGSGDQIACMFIAEARSINKIAFYPTTINGTAPTYDFRLETVDSNGQPSGTLAAANTNVTFQPSSAGVWNEVTLTSSYTPTDSEVLAGVIKYSSGTIDGSNNMVVAYRHGPGRNSPRVAQDLSVASWTEENLVPAFGPLYASDGDPPVGFILRSGGTVITFDAADSPDEYGNGFAAPFSGVLNGFEVPLRVLAGATAEARIYEGTVQLDSVTVNESMVENNSTRDRIFIPMSDIDIVVGRTYRITIKATHATNTLQIQESTFRDAAAVKACAGFPLFATERTDSGAFTDTPANVFGCLPVFKSFLTGISPDARNKDIKPRP